MSKCRRHDWWVQIAAPFTVKGDERRWTETWWVCTECQRRERTVQLSPPGLVPPQQAQMRATQEGTG